MRGWVMASSFARASESEKTISANASRRNSPAESFRSAPNVWQISSSAGSPGCTTCRASSSVSTTAMPRSRSRRAAVDLPMPIPPVRPKVFTARLSQDAESEAKSKSTTSRHWCRRAIEAHTVRPAAGIQHVAKTIYRDHTGHCLPVHQIGGNLDVIELVCLSQDVQENQPVSLTTGREVRWCGCIDRHNNRKVDVVDEGGVQTSAVVGILVVAPF